MPAKEASCKEVILRGADIDLKRLPVLTTWPGDGGPFLTLPCVITRDARSGKRNVGMYRMQVYDGQTTGMHWQRQKVAAEQVRDRLRATVGTASDAVDLMALTNGGVATARNADLPTGLQQKTITTIRNNRLEVAVAIGTDPATTFFGDSPGAARSRRVSHRWISARPTG